MFTLPNRGGLLYVCSNVYVTRMKYYIWYSQQKVILEECVGMQIQIIELERLDALFLSKISTCENVGRSPYAEQTEYPVR